MAKPNSTNNSDGHLEALYDPSAEDSLPPPVIRNRACPPMKTPPDPFNPESLRIGQSVGSTASVKNGLHSVPIRKPDKTWFFRTHSDPRYRLETKVLELKEEGEIYLVSRDLWPTLSAETSFGARALFTAMNRQGLLFLWPVVLPGPDGKTMDWHRSALEAANRASRSWIRMQPNISIGAYEILEASGDLGDPKWPDSSFKEILAVAFRDRKIDSLDHPVLRRLRGEV